MKKLKSMVVIFAAITFTFTSCEKENLENTTVASESRQALDANALGKGDLNESLDKIKVASGPQSIEELIENGISVSRGLAAFLGNDFDLLIYASDLSIHDPERLRNGGFFESEIQELVQINLQYNVLINFSPAVPGPGIPRVRNLSELIGQWNVDSFKVGAISAFGARYELVDDLSRINSKAAPSALANGFEITATEFRYTNNGIVVDSFPLGANDGSFLSVIIDGQEEKVFNVPLITLDGNTLTFTFFTTLDNGRRRIASYRLTRG